MKSDPSSVLVIIAALNEEEGIGPTLSELKQLGRSTVLVVDGHSTDNTAHIANSMGACVILQNGSGKGDAISTAIGHARSIDSQYVAFIDADFTYPVEYLYDMIEILQENPDVGMVCGNRFNDHFETKYMTNVFYTGNRIISYIHNLLNGIKMHDPLTGLRAVRSDLLKDWHPKSKGFDIEVELNHYVESKGYNIIEVPIYYRPRLGVKKLRPKHGFTILRRILIQVLA